MISHVHKCIFVHIPKCAGTSIESALGHHEHFDGRGRQDHRTLAQVQPWNFGSAFHLESRTATRKNLLALRKRSPNPANRFQITAAQYLQYYKFTIVRNPWSRCISWYNNAMRDADHRRDLRLSPESFKDFLKLQIGKGMLRPQTYWLKDRAGKIAFDFIGRYETLDDDFRKACLAIGSPEIELPRLLKGVNCQPASEYYDQESDALVRAAFSEEISLFCYDLSTV